MIPSIINNAFESRLGRIPDGSTPLQMMTGINPLRTILQILSAVGNTSVALTFECTIAERTCGIHPIQRSIHEKDKDVFRRVTDRHFRAIDQHNAAINIVTFSFEVGDVVVNCKAQRPVHKLSFRWYGPCRIQSVKSPAVCIVEILNAHRHERMHVTRIRKYRRCCKKVKFPVWFWFLLTDP